MFDIKRVTTKVVVALPSILQRVTRCAPNLVQQQMIQLALNRFFSAELAAGELAFLQQKTVVVSVKDINLQFGIRLNGKALQVELSSATQDLLIQASLADFIAMICQQVDPDTLFFRRRLQLLGDTELGLECKNLLDRIGPERLPTLLSHGLNWLAQQNMAQDAI